MDLLTLIIVLFILTAVGGMTGIIAGQLLYIILAVIAVVFVLSLLGIIVI